MRELHTKVDSLQQEVKRNNTKLVESVAAVTAGVVVAEQRQNRLMRQSIEEMDARVSQVCTVHVIISRVYG